ncbi:MAG: hypothetical protein CMJ32_06935, partial [Phycisphaerae bacterium]|nr:hypothetical protein [Phycisphaerae bacterium]
MALALEPTMSHAEARDRHERLTGMIHAFVLLAWLGIVSGCTSLWKPPERVRGPEKLELTHHIGGTHHCVMVIEGRWYQSYGSELMIIDPDTGRSRRTMELGKVGHDGPIVDMVRHGQTLYVVLEHDALIAIDIIDPDNPV